MLTSNIHREKSVRILIFTLFLLSSAVFGDHTQEYQLTNGLKLIVREDHRAPVVMSSIWYKVGGSYENNGTTGISHMLEHMMFRGTKKFGPGVLNQIFSAQGSDQNALTSDDFTMYHQLLPANQLALSFELEADRMENLLLDPVAFEIEKKVVLEERRMRVDDSPEGLLWERFSAAAFINNPYHNPIVGWMPDVSHLTIDDVRHWYRKWYAPNNAVIIVAGDVKSSDVYQLVQKYFGNLKPIQLPVLKPRTEVVSTGERTVNVKTPAKLPYILMGFNVPTLANATQNQVQSLYALKVISYILSGGESARFVRDLVRGKEIALSVDASYDLYDLHQSLFVIGGIPSFKNNNDQLEKNIWVEINALKNKLVSTEELRRVKTALIANKIYKQDSLESQIEQLGFPEMAGLSWKASDDFISKISSVTPDEIQAAAKTYFTAENETIGELQPALSSNKKQD